MAFFKKRVTKAGKVNFFKDGHALKPEEVDILPALIKNMDPGDSIELDLPEPPATDPIQTAVPASKEIGDLHPEPNVSIISGEPATRRRWLNGQEYWVTEDEHKTYTLGKLAQVVREKQEAAAKTVEE